MTLRRKNASIRTFAPLFAPLFATAVLFAACKAPPPPDPRAELVAKGERIFFRETFAGNGRTCGTCHPADNNFTIDPPFIARLAPDNPLFVAEFNPSLAKNFENSQLMREFGLILENLDGFDDLANRFVMRGVPHVLAQRTSIESPQGPRTGWSGDGSPGDGSLRSFATGAVIQHFTKTLHRVADVDFRLPTEEELDAIEAFMLSLGRQAEFTLPLPLKGTVSKRGQVVFLDNTLGKCNFCHANAGANANFGKGSVGNANFDTGVENLPDLRQRLSGQRVPRDDGFGRPGDGTFNTPPLVEAADTGPFFHNNAVETIEGAVAFYNGQAFNESASGRLLASLDPRGIGIRLDGTQVESVAVFLRVLNAPENIRSSIELLQRTQSKHRFAESDLVSELARAIAETGDGIRVLTGAGLHPQAVKHLEEARRLERKAERSSFFRGDQLRAAIDELRKARAELVESP